MSISVKLVCVYVRDQDAALAFYRDKLGFTVATDAPFGESGRWLEMAAPGGGPRVVLSLPQSPANVVGGFSNIIFTTDDIQKDYELLQNNGVEVTAPDVQPWGTFIIFTDLDGNQFVTGTTDD
ncbi:hypothetical protein CCAX7_21880 [Capsulimonas corticalis]|uniref:Uncharacterized protein n=1 Tax=Capsulimonas corticalis TaxID=2219043 RepID=A0A402D278_9BACT|nr:VOC family protein [Capsulimonas corticalis]BDI30137.1 hypothetical protein CCAX7_21880 [Capsulimonas corticalis]